jgi:hypothetical protein
MLNALKLSGFGLMLLIAGCAPQQAHLGLPAEPVPVSPRPGLALPLPIFYDEVQVRAFLTDQAGQRREVGNASCRLQTPGYTAEFSTPARVVVPVFRAGNPALDVTCRAGEREGATRRVLLRRPVGHYPSPWYGPRRWPGDPYFPHGGRSGVWVGVEIGDPGWGWGWDDPWWPRRAAPTYPNIEVQLQ